jgi:hypothetical protein
MAPKAPLKFTPLAKPLERSTMTQHEIDNIDDRKKKRIIENREQMEHNMDEMENMMDKNMNENKNEMKKKTWMKWKIR